MLLRGGKKSVFSLPGSLVNNALEENSPTVFRIFGQTAG